MQKTPDKASRELPSLDLLKGFEAAARTMSFTKAAAELFVTQSAISRQVKTLEDQLGIPLFRRRHRELLLTEAGQTLFKTTGEVLRMLRDTTGRLRSGRGGMLTVAATISFASLWLVPRLNAFRQLHPEIEVRIAANNDLQDLERESIDLAIRYSLRKAAGEHAQSLFGESVFPVCSRELLAGAKIKSPQDLERYVLLHLDDVDRRTPWLSWNVWFELVRAHDVKPAGNLRFSHYDQMIQAALDNQGIALGRSPLVDRFIRNGQLVLPFGKRFVTSPADSRAYFIVVPPSAASRPEVAAFSQWLKQEAQTGLSEAGNFATAPATAPAR
jgi:LysR family transcriptional regulator, glycine cleavage system transcriptional activator